MKTELKAGEAKDAKVEAELKQRAAQVPGLIRIEHCNRGPRVLSSGASSNSGGLDLRTALFDRALDVGWRRSSYTSITSEAHGGLSAATLVGSEPESSGTTDEPASLAAGESDGGDPATARSGDEDLTGSASLLSDVPAGATFGTFVHRVLENVDFAAPDLRAELLAAIHGERAGYPEGTTGAPAQLAAGLEAAISAPLGGGAGPARLRDLDRTDRLDELGFELPIAGGDDPVGEVLVADLARLYSVHVRTGQPLAGYVHDLAGPHLAANLRGYLTGSLDLVFRLRGPGREKFFVVDYKTNWLGAVDQPLTAWHYRPDALEAEMRRAHYPLQAMLYLVALHRYLRWRMPGYDPAVNLGGAFYLFLRGMACPGVSTADGGAIGAFGWSPPTGLVTGLSDLLAGHSNQTRWDSDGRRRV